MSSASFTLLVKRQVTVTGGRRRLLFKNGHYLGAGAAGASLDAAALPASSTTGAEVVEAGLVRPANRPRRPNA